MKLTKDQKLKVEKSAKLHIADLLSSDHGDPFKHRELPDLGIPWASEGETDEEAQAAEEAYDLADDYFFDCIKKVAQQLRREGKAK